MRLGLFGAIVSDDVLSLPKVPLAASGITGRLVIKHEQEATDICAAAASMLKLNWPADAPTRSRFCLPATRKGASFTKTDLSTPCSIVGRFLELADVRFRLSPSNLRALVAAVVHGAEQTSLVKPAARAGRSDFISATAALLQRRFPLPAALAAAQDELVVVLDHGDGKPRKLNRRNDDPQAWPAYTREAGNLVLRQIRMGGAAVLIALALAQGVMHASGRACADTSFDGTTVDNIARVMLVISPEQRAACAAIRQWRSLLDRLDARPSLAVDLPTFLPDQLSSNTQSLVDAITSAPTATASWSHCSALAVHLHDVLDQLRIAKRVRLAAGSGAPAPDLPDEGPTLIEQENVPQSPQGSVVMDVDDGASDESSAQGQSRPPATPTDGAKAPFFVLSTYNAGGSSPSAEVHVAQAVEKAKALAEGGNFILTISETWQNKAGAAKLTAALPHLKSFNMRTRTARSGGVALVWPRTMADPTVLEQNATESLEAIFARVDHVGLLIVAVYRRPKDSGSSMTSDLQLIKSRALALANDGDRVVILGDLNADSKSTHTCKSRGRALDEWMQDNGMERLTHAEYGKTHTAANGTAADLDTIAVPSNMRVDRAELGSETSSHRSVHARIIVSDDEAARGKAYNPIRLDQRRLRRDADLVRTEAAAELERLLADESLNEEERLVASGTAIASSCLKVLGRRKQATRRGPQWAPLALVRRWQAASRQYRLALERQDPIGRAAVARKTKVLRKDTRAAKAAHEAERASAMYAPLASVRARASSMHWAAARTARGKKAMATVGPSMQNATAAMTEVMNADCTGPVNNNLDDLRAWMMEDTDEPAEYDITQTEVTVEEVRQALKKLRPGTSPDESAVSTDVLRTLLLEEIPDAPDGPAPDERTQAAWEHDKADQAKQRTLLGAIATMATSAFRRGRWPEQLKHGLTTLISKGARTIASDATTYRPIGSLPLLSRVLERIAHERIRRIEHEHGSFAEREQLGFQNQMGATQPLATMRGIIDYRTTRNLDTVVVGLDATKAYDRVTFRAIIAEMKLKGFSRNTCSLVLSMLEQRTTRVVAGGRISTPITAFRGVVQGSVLSPWLYNMAANCLLRAVRRHGVPTPGGDGSIASVTFADDVSLVLASVQNAILAVKDVTEVGERIGWSINWPKSNWTCMGPHRDVILQREELIVTQLDGSTRTIAAANSLHLLGAPLTDSGRAPERYFATKLAAAMRAWGKFCHGAAPEGIRAARDTLRGGLFPSVSYAWAIAPPTAKDMRNAGSTWATATKRALALPCLARTRLASDLAGILPLADQLAVDTLSLAAQLAHSTSALVRQVHVALLDDAIDAAANNSTPPDTLQARALALATQLGLNARELDPESAERTAAHLREDAKFAVCAPRPEPSVLLPARPYAAHHRPPWPVRRLPAADVAQVTFMAGRTFLAPYYGSLGTNELERCPFCLSAADAPMHLALHCTDPRLAKIKLAVPAEAWALVGADFELWNDRPPPDTIALGHLACQGIRDLRKARKELRARLDRGEDWPAVDIAPDGTSRSAALQDLVRATKDILSGRLGQLPTDQDPEADDSFAKTMLDAEEIVGGLDNWIDNGFVNGHARPGSGPEGRPVVFGPKAATRPRPPKIDPVAREARARLEASATAAARLERTRYARQCARRAETAVGMHAQPPGIH